VAVLLKGMTWSHPRGYDPMAATAAIWKSLKGVEVSWDKRSLQDFESFPVEELARAYDLIVIDHPHVGQIVRENCLSPLDLPDRQAEAAALAKASVGKSYQSYQWNGRQWALPIDAATQVMAYRADLLASPPQRWSEIVDLARAGRVALPLRPPHSLMCFFTLCDNLGSPCNSTGPGQLVDKATGVQVIGMLAELAAVLDPAFFEMDPIAASEAMSVEGARWHVMPYAYGYVSYSVPGFRPRRLTFADIPAAGEFGPRGGTLGGTGVAVSAFCKHQAEAIEHAYWLASADVQRGPYAEAGGQPGNAVAWEDERVNAAAGNFYRNTRATLEASYVRPRHDGYMGFQDAGSHRLNEGLRNHEDPEQILAALDELFQKSFPERRR